MRLHVIDSSFFLKLGRQRYVCRNWKSCEHIHSKHCWKGFLCSWTDCSNMRMIPFCLRFLHFPYPKLAGVTGKTTHSLSQNFHYLALSFLLLSYFGISEIYKNVKKAFFIWSSKQTSCSITSLSLLAVWEYLFTHCECCSLKKRNQIKGLIIYHQVAFLFLKLHPHPKILHEWQILKIWTSMWD